MPTVNGKARKLIEVFEGKVGENSVNIVRFLSALTIESLLRTSFGLEKDFINNPFHRFFAIVKKFVKLKKSSNLKCNFQGSFEHWQHDF